VDKITAPFNRNTTEDLWLSLDELKDVAVSAGCTLAQFDYAVEVAGVHPIRVARYLREHAFLPATFEIP
jgi:hypothetical protein